VILDELNLLEKLKAKSVFLLEPDYRRKYPPLGLAKIASYILSQGGNVRYGRTYSGEPCDLVCVTSLFTYDSAAVLGAIGQVRFFGDRPIIVGGIYASLMPKHILRHYDVDIFRGYSRTLDQCVPADLDWGVESPWNQYSYVFTSRGCPNQCPYCAVWRIEPDRWINPVWKDHITKDYVMISDNNLSACDHIYQVLDYLGDTEKRVIIDNGFDCKYINVDMARRLARLKFERQGMRIAFDRIQEDGIFQKAIETLISAGVSKYNITAYVLFNFTDTPREADYRARECHKLGIRPYPQMYTPLHQTDREHPFVGKHWTLNLAKAFRFYWLFGGIYRHMTFDEFIHNPMREQSLGHFTLTAEDLAVWG
jgi:hypothetical protein